MSFANSRAAPSVKAVSVVSSSKLSTATQKKKRSQLDKQPAKNSYSQRFQSIFFSLYNPQDREKVIFDALPLVDSPTDANNDKQSNEEYPQFNSPLCAYKIKTEIEENKSTRDQLLQSFHAHSSQLVNELSLKEYDKIEVSMVPFDVERTGDDRSHKEPRRQSDEKMKDIQDARSTTSYKSRTLPLNNQTNPSKRNSNQLQTGEPMQDDMTKIDDKNMNEDNSSHSPQQTQELLHPRARKNIPHPCSPNQTKTDNDISQSSDNDIKMGIKFSEFDHQPSISAVRRNTPIPGQYKINLNALSSSSSSINGSGTINSTDKPRSSSSKVPSIPLNKARQSSPTNSGQIPNVKMNIDFNKFDNSGSSIRLPTPRPGQTIGPGGIPEDEYYKLTNSYKSPEEEEESGEPDMEDEDYGNVRIDINQLPNEEDLNMQNIVIDANNLDGNENVEEEFPDVKVDIDFSKFDNQEHSNRLSTPRSDKQNIDDDAISLGEEEEEAEVMEEPNEMENIQINIPQEFGNPEDDNNNNNDNADVLMNIDFSKFDVNNRPITMSTPRPTAPDEGIELEEDEEEIEEPKNEVKRPIPAINNNNNKPKRIPMLPKIPNVPGSLPAPKIPKKVAPIPINFANKNVNNKADENNNNDVKVDIDFKQFDGAERAIRMPTPRPAETVNDENDISLGEEEEEAIEEDEENEMANIVIAIPLEPVEEDTNEPGDDTVTMNIDFSQFDGPATSNHMSTPRPDKSNDEGINAEEEAAEDAEATEEEKNEETTYSNTRKFTFTSPVAPKRTASTPSPSPNKSFKFSIPPSSDADNDFNTDTLTDNDDIQFYVPNENNLSTPRPGQSCVREAFKDAQRAAKNDDDENDDDINDEPIVINASIPVVPQLDIENSPGINDDIRPMRRSTPRPTHHKKVIEVELHTDSSDEENNNDIDEQISPSKNKPYRTNSTPPFKVKSAANYKLPLIPLNVLVKKQSEDDAGTETIVNTDPVTDSTPKNGGAVVGCSSTPAKKKVVSSPPKSNNPSPAKIPLLNFGNLKDSDNNNNNT